MIEWTRISLFRLAHVRMLLLIGSDWRRGTLYERDSKIGGALDMFDTSEDLFVHAVDDKQGDVRKRRGGKERVVFGSVAREKKSRLTKPPSDTSYSYAIWIGYGITPLDRSHTVLLVSTSNASINVCPICRWPWAWNSTTGSCSLVRSQPSFR